MNNNNDLEEANNEIEKSKETLSNMEDVKHKEDDDELKERDLNKNEKKEEGSGIFTADGEELPKIDGGYDIIEPGGNMGNDDFVSV
jgi:hypothetical protein